MPSKGSSLIIPGNCMTLMWLCLQVYVFHGHCLKQWVLFLTGSPARSMRATAASAMSMALAPTLGATSGLRHIRAAESSRLASCRAQC